MIVERTCWGAFSTSSNNRAGFNVLLPLSVLELFEDGRISTTDGEIGMHLLTRENDVWLFEIIALKRLKLFNRLSHGRHISRGSVSSLGSFLP